MLDLPRAAAALREVREMVPIMRNYLSRFEHSREVG
jgi:hypothetical protein